MTDSKDPRKEICSDCCEDLDIVKDTYTYRNRGEAFRKLIEDLDDKSLGAAFDEATVEDFLNKIFGREELEDGLWAMEVLDWLSHKQWHNNGCPG